MDCGATVLIFLAIIQATCGQSLDLVSPNATERGSNTVYTCTVTGGSSPYVFIWQDVSRNNLNIFASGVEVYPDGETRYLNFEVLEDGAGTSTVTIMNTQIEDEGSYRCTEKQLGDAREFTVEVRYTLELSVASTVESNNDIYTATCDAVQGRPNVTITWMLGTNEAPCDNPMVTYMQAPPDLFSKRSVCTFQATRENYGETLRCIISGHQVADLNGEKTFTLNTHSAPAIDGIMTVGFQFLDPDLRVSCDIADTDQPTPRIRNYYIYSNGTLKNSDTAVDFVVVPESEFDIYTEFLCVAGNYLGNTTSPAATFNPDSPTTLPTPTDMMTSPEPNDGNETGPPSGPGGLSAGATAGIAIGAVLLIVIIVLIIYFVWKKGKDGPSGASSTKKHGSSTVGTSNGSEKDKIKPVAAPRDQGSIQHTTDNPGQAEYAMVDRKKPGGADMPDTRGPGQKEPQGMLYADLDLSASAGHTEKKVPQNKDDVVVYSSILV